MIKCIGIVCCVFRGRDYGFEDSSKITDKKNGESPGDKTRKARLSENDVKPD
jgi:hypothetical protein